MTSHAPTAIKAGLNVPSNDVNKDKRCYFELPQIFIFVRLSYAMCTVSAKASDLVKTFSLILSRLLDFYEMYWDLLLTFGGLLSRYKSNVIFV